MENQTIITQAQRDEIVRINMERQTSLTAPADKVETTKFNITPSLNTSELIAAKEVLVTPFFRPVERKFTDPPIPQQVYCIHSFVPAKGASPDKDGVYGMVKCRGVFSSLEEADQKATELIKKVDSIHKYHISKVGHPFPMTYNSKFASEQKEIDLKEKTEEIMSSDLKEQTQDQKNEIKEIKEREKMLREDVKAENPLEKYIMTRVKRAQLVWTYVQNAKKLSEMFGFIIKAEKEIAQMDQEYPGFKEHYRDRYNEARRESGIPEHDDSFIKYLDLQDIKLPKVIVYDD